MELPLHLCQKQLLLPRIPFPFGSRPWFHRCLCYFLQKPARSQVAPGRWSGQCCPAGTDVTPDLRLKGGEKGRAVVCHDASVLLSPAQEERSRWVSSLPAFLLLEVSRVPMIESAFSSLSSFPLLGRNLLSCQEGLRSSEKALQAFYIAYLRASLAQSPW